MAKAFLPVGKAEVTSSILVISSCPKPEQVSGFFFTPKYFRLFMVMCIARLYHGSVYAYVTSLE